MDLMPSLRAVRRLTDGLAKETEPGAIPRGCPGSKLLLEAADKQPCTDSELAVLGAILPADPLLRQLVTGVGEAPPEVVARLRRVLAERANPFAGRLDSPGPPRRPPESPAPRPAGSPGMEGRPFRGGIAKKSLRRPGWRRKPRKT